MNSEHWERVQLLFEEALAHPPDRRVAFIDAACGAETDLRDEVASLLAAHEGKGDMERLPPVWLGTLAGPEPPRFVATERVAGRYLIHRLIGRGGTGEVYEAWDEELSIPVALKTLHLTAGTHEAFQRLMLEGFLARSVWHPNVCRVYDFGRHGDGKDAEGENAVWFLTMELLSGEPLSQRLRAQGRLPLNVALRFAQQMAAGLEAAHRSGVVHRDFKPSNVVLVKRDGDEEAMVADFGVARSVLPRRSMEDPSAGFPEFIGTPAYMAPEQVLGGEVGPAADIFALGVVLYEMVTGALPFTGPSAIEMARCRLTGEAPSPRRIVPDLDDRWEAVILRCLAREPMRRFMRAEHVADALAGRATAEGIDTLEIKGRGWHTLPVERDFFVGREKELQELERNLSGPVRVVTLLGPGGMGKTRLAVSHGWRSLGKQPGGVWFCNLTDARDVNAIAMAVAQSLGLQLGEGDPLTQIGHAIAGRGRCLIILDNCEQVVEFAEIAVAQWLERADQARFLVTSRERLNLGDQETVQALEPLSSDRALELFVARTQRLRPGLELVGAELDAGREIVRLVDGMPLAIELAAARMRVMSATQIAKQMRKRFQLLTGGVTARHETLAAAIDGSWDLLSAWERSAWEQCAVFEGGFTLEAAEAVVDLQAWSQAPGMVNVIQSLVDKSLLKASMPAQPRPEDVPEARFGMYVSLQEYARVRLREADRRAREGEAKEIQAELRAEQRHGQWYAQYGSEQAIEALSRSRGERWRKLERELGNLMAACRRALERGDGKTVAATYRAWWAVLQQRGPLGSALDLGLEAIRDPRLGRDQRASILQILGNVERFIGRIEDATSHLESALVYYREIGDRLSECTVLENLSTMLCNQGRLQEAQVLAETTLALSRAIGARRAEGGILGCLGRIDRHEGRTEKARDDFEAALAIHREVGNRRLEGITLGNLAIPYSHLGKPEEARSCLERALAIDRELGNRHSEGIALGNLGSLHQVLGQLQEARRYYEAALESHREVGNRRFEGIALSSLGNLHRLMDQIALARSHLDTALAIHREVGNRLFEGITIEEIGVLHFREGRDEEARDCYETALDIHREAGNRRYEGVALRLMGSLLQRQGRIEEASATLAEGETILRELSDLPEIGMLLCARAELEQRRGNRARASAALSEATALADRARSGPESELGRRIAELEETLSAW